MNRFAKQSNTEQEATTIIHVPVRDAYAAASVDELIAHEVSKEQATRKVEQSFLKRAFSSPWAKVGLGAFVVLALVPQIMIARMNASLNEDLKTLKAMDVPLTEADLVPPAVRLRDNAGPIYKDAFRKLELPGPEATAFAALRKCDIYGVVQETVVLPSSSSDPGTLVLPRPTAASSKRDAAAFVAAGPVSTSDYGVLPNPAPASSVQKQLESLKPLTDAVRQASKLPNSFYSDPRDFSRTPVKFTEWFIPTPLEFACPAYFKDQAEELICLTAIVEMESGNEAQGAKDLLTAARIINQSSCQYDASWTGQSLIPGWYFQKRCWALALRHPNDRKMLADIANAYDALNETLKVSWLLGRGVPGELSDYRYAVGHPTEYQTTVRQHKADPAPLWSSSKVVMSMAERQLVHQWRILFETLATNPENVTACKKAIEKAQTDSAAEWPVGNYLDFYFHSKADFCDTVGDELASHHLYGEAIHLLLYRAENGVFPPTLPSYGMQSIDPYTGKDMIYKPTAKGFTLYSLGVDLKDDGGSGAGSSSGKDLIDQGNDIVISYP